MVFSSSTFMFVFLPVVVALYFVCPGRPLKNTLLFAASLVFYAWGEPVYVLLMLFSIVCNWIFGLAIGQRRDDAADEPVGKHVRADDGGSGDASGSTGTATHEVRRKVLLAAIVVIDVLVIAFFKYEGWLAENINSLAGAEVVPDLDLPLPIGISFYTLQALSYVVDVYRGEVKPQRNFLYLGMYVACFPQLIAGPIVRYSTIEDQIRNRKENLADFASGLRLFAIGFVKKTLLANVVAVLADSMLGYSGSYIGAVGAWAGVIAYTFQIYFDFGGYSDMAIGLGRMFGFKYLRNFNYPYISRSITEFWRRWHISLSSFFRDYVYIPLGGNRVTVPRHIFNMLVVWTITGLWHGAAWNFVLWGLWYGVLLVCEKYIWGRGLARLPRVLQHVYTMVIVVLGWALFMVSDFSQLVDYFTALFGGYGLVGSLTPWQLEAWAYWPVFVVCIIASTPLLPWAKERLSAWAEGRDAAKIGESGIVSTRCYEASSLCVFEVEPASASRGRTVSVLLVLADVALLVLFAIGLMSVISGTFNPFIYFQF